MSRSLEGRSVVRVCGGVLVVLLALGVWHNALATSAWAQDARHVQSDNQEQLARIAATACHPAFYYEVNMPAYKLRFADEYTPEHFGPELARLYPNSLFYNLFGHRFQTFTGPVDAKAMKLLLKHDRCITLVGSPVERYPDFGMPRDDFLLVARTDHGLADSVAVYAWQPK